MLCVCFGGLRWWAILAQEMFLFFYFPITFSIIVARLVIVVPHFLLISVPAPLRIIGDLILFAQLCGLPLLLSSIILCSLLGGSLLATVCCCLWIPSCPACSPSPLQGVGLCPWKYVLLNLLQCVYQALLCFGAVVNYPGSSYNHVYDAANNSQNRFTVCVCVCMFGANWDWNWKSEMLDRFNPLAKKAPDDSWLFVEFISWSDDGTTYYAGNQSIEES